MLPVIRSAFISDYFRTRKFFFGRDRYNQAVNKQVYERYPRVRTQRAKQLDIATGQLLLSPPYRIRCSEHHHAECKYKHRVNINMNIKNSLHFRPQ